MSEMDILAAEERLRLAMVASDVAALDGLLSDDLVFTSHTGQVIGKADELGAHRSGIIKIDSAEFGDTTIVRYGDVVIVSVRTTLTGQFAGHPVNGVLRFTRVWATAGPQAGRVLAGHASMVAG